MLSTVKYSIFLRSLPDMASFFLFLTRVGGWVKGEADWVMAEGEGDLIMVEGDWEGVKEVLGGDEKLDLERLGVLKN